MNSGRCFLIVALVFGAALAIVVGARMSAEALAVVVGIVCGVAAGIPTVLLLMSLMGPGDRQPRDLDRRDAPYGASPPVVVIQGGASQCLPPGQQAAYWPVSMQGTPAIQDSQLAGDEALLGDGWR